MGLFKRKNTGASRLSGLAISPQLQKDARLSSDFILSAIQDGVVIVGPDNNIHLFNPAASTISGWPAQEALGLNFDSVLVLVNEKGEKCPPEAHPVAKAL